MSNARTVVSFVYPKPVSGRNFIGRKQEMAILAGNLAKGQCTAFYGAPGSGRTSLLLHFTDRENLNSLLGTEAQEYYFVFNDLKRTDPQRGFAADAFWHVIVASLQETYQEALFRETNEAAESEGEATLVGILENFARTGRKLILLIDNFSLLYDERAHAQGGLPVQFHHRLRSFALQYPLIIVCATDRTLTDLDKSDGIWFSPLVGIFQERHCAAFNRDELNQFNSWTLDGSGKNFTRDDLDFIHQLTFGFPILCQISADKLLEYREKAGWDHRLTGQQQESIFDEVYWTAQQALTRLWTSLTADERIILMYIVLTHRGGREVNNISYKISKNDPDLFGFKGWRVNRLIRFQLVMQNKSHDRYEIASPLLERFVADQVRSKQYPELEDRKTRFLVFSQAQFDRFKNVVRDHEAVFIQIGAKLFENWMSRD